MKKLLITFILLSSYLMAEKAYVACEATKKEAKASLVTQIVSTMESEFSSEVKVSTGEEEKATKEAKQTIKSSSKLTLSEVSYFEKEGEVCAQITQEKLISIAKGKLKTIKYYTLEKLPSEEIALVNYLEERLDQIKQTTAIVTLMAKEFKEEDIKLLEEKYKLLQDERSRHHAQKVSFQVTPEEAVLLIDGKPQNRHHNIFLSAGIHAYTLQLPEYSPFQGSFEIAERQEKSLTVDLAGNRFPLITFSLNEKGSVVINDAEYPVNSPISLAPGEYTYTVKSEGFCPLLGTINARLGTNQTVTLDISHQTFPQVTINSNQEFAELKIDAESFPLGKTHTFNVCQDKEISYTVSFDKQSRQGTVQLTPGLVKTLSVDFLTQLDIRSLQNQAVSYQDGSRLILRAAYELAPVSMPVYTFDKINQRGWLRYGWGLLYGNHNSKLKVDAHYTLALQLTDFGAKEMPLHVGSFALIPFIGVQGGGTFLKETTQQASWMSKALIGVDFVLNKTIGFEFFLYKNFLFQQEVSFGTALSLKNPF